MIKTARLAGFALLAFCAATAPLRAQEPANFNIAIKEHHFEPAELDVPAGIRFTVTVKNLNSGPAEFESTVLNREKVVVGGASITVYLGPLTPGSYEFFN
ncbi:MAG TPA: cupredoxin domain-containing protein, partial [Stellaceae bacterium]|nr:cupredoxin domain-containing protein [Stellaceae bacterium]